MSGLMQSLRALARLKPAQKLTRDYLVSLLTAVLLALAVGAGIMLVCGHNPIEGYGALIEGALGKPRAIGNTLAKAMTLALCGLAMSVAAKAGIFNVGGEGQLFMGALAAAVRWYDAPGLKNILYVALLVGGSMAAKLAGALCAPAIALLFLYKWWKNRQETRRYFAWFAAFAAICVPLGLGWSVLNWVRWGVPLGYVPVLSTDNYQYVGMYSPWQRLFDFFGGKDANVFMAFADRSGAGYYE